MTLFEVIVWVMSGGGAGALTFWLMENVPQLKVLAPQYKRYVSLGLAGGLAVAAWLILIVLGYVTAPETVQAWIEELFSVAFGAVVVSQTVHGAIKLGNGKGEGDA